MQNAAAYEEMINAIRGIQRGLDPMKEGKGEPARIVLIASALNTKFIGTDELPKNGGNATLAVTYANDLPSEGR